MKRILSIFFSLFVVVLCVPKLNATPPVLILDSDSDFSWPQDVQYQLSNYCRADYFDVHFNGTLTLSLLNQYKSLLLYDWIGVPFGNSSGDSLGNSSGDLVAQFLSSDPNHFVCLMGMAMNATDGVTGVFETSWSPVNYINTLFGSTEYMVKDLPQDPLLSGVFHFSGGDETYRNNISLRAGTKLIAHWNDSVPFIVANPSYTVRVVNIYPPSSDKGTEYWPVTSANGSRLLANCACPGFTPVLFTTSSSKSNSISNSNSNSNSLSWSISPSPLTSPAPLCFHLIGRKLQKKLLSSVCNQQLKGTLYRVSKDWCCFNIPKGPFSFSWPDKVADCSLSALYNHHSNTNKTDIAPRGTNQKFFDACQALVGTTSCSNVRPASITLRKSNTYKVWITCSGIH